MGFGKNYVLPFAKVLRFLHDSLQLDGFAFANVSNPSFEAENAIKTKKSIIREPKVQKNRESNPAGGEYTVC